MKLTSDRRWWLAKWELGGWSPPHGRYVGTKKWDGHTAALVKMGLLEAHEHGLYRITDSGRAALAEAAQ